MSSRNYINFDLSIERDQDRYRARVLQSCAGEGQIAFDLPFSSLELENLTLRMGHSRRGTGRSGRGSDSAELTAAKEFGAKLFGSVFQGDVYACLRASLEEAEAREQGVRVLLRLPPDLANLPWEYLYNPAWNQFFSLSVGTPLVRYLELTPPVHPLALKPPLRLLVVISSPSDYDPLDVECEWDNLQKALQPLVERGLVEIERLSGASLLALQRQLRRGTYHIFHFVGHGIFDERKQDGLLLFTDEQGRGRPLSGQDLGTLLRDHNSLRLAMLNACEGARTSEADPFAGAAYSLVQMGLPAVIAMQFEISDSAAVLFAQEFYTALADGYGVDAALTDARKSIFASMGSVEWGTPVLFSRTLDGKIFDLSLAPTGEAPPAAPPSVPGPKREVPRSAASPDLARLYEDGLSACQLGDWQRARDIFQSIVTTRSDYRDAARLLEKAEAEIIRRNPLLWKAQLVSWLRSNWKGATISILALIGLVTVVLSLLNNVVIPVAAPLMPATTTPTPTLTLPPTLTQPPTPTQGVTSTPVPAVSGSTPSPALSPTAMPTPTATLTMPLGMALIPAGSFKMGSDQDPDERPVHTVNLVAFWIDVHEVTNIEYIECVKDKKCRAPSSKSSYSRPSYYDNEQFANYPVLYVSWSDADAYCKWRDARLPSEAEWEKAARGGLEGQPYPWGDDDPTCKLGAANGVQFDECTVKDVLAIKSFAPNKYGLFDMAGNAWEWVNDNYTPSYNASSSGSNPPAPVSSDSKVVRGGAWNTINFHLRAANRIGYSPVIRYPTIGFRCVITP
jgi:formylglycine-generating enzyme required for sulfatase activity